MTHQHSTASSLGPVQPGFFQKTRIAARLRTLVLTLLGLIAALLPAIGSAQTTDLQAWQETIKSTSPPASGCYQATYPGMQWQQVPCTRSQDIAVPAPQSSTGGLRIPAIGGSGDNDYMVYAQGGNISSATGKFADVIAQTLTADTPYFTFSLQLNSNTFPLTSSKNRYCGNNTGCRRWVQFVFEGTASLFGDYPGLGGVASIEYVIIGTSPCPSGFHSNSGDCYMGTSGVSVPGLYGSSINLGSYLSNLKLNGQTNPNNGTDTVMAIYGGRAYAKTVSSVFKEFPPGLAAGPVQYLWTL